MKRKNVFFSALLASLLIAVVAGAARASDEAAEPIQAGTSSVVTAAPQPALTGLDLQIAQIREQGQARVQEIVARLEAVDRGSSEALAIQREIYHAKIDTEASVLRAIAADAREKGDVARASEADLALDHLLHPEKYAAAPVPSGRPAPQPN